MRWAKWVWVGVMATIWLLRIWGYADYRVYRAKLAEHCGQIINGTYAYCGDIRTRPANVVFMDLTEPPMGFWDPERRLLREWGVTPPPPDPR